MICMNTSSIGKLFISKIWPTSVNRCSNSFTSSNSGFRMNFLSFQDSCRSRLLEFCQLTNDQDLWLVHHHSCPSNNLSLV